MSDDARIGPRPKRRGRHSIGEIALVVLACGYAALLLGGPILAIGWGALSSGLSAFVSEVTSPDAVDAFMLTLGLSVAATVLNTVFGIVIAWVLVRGDIPGRAFLNGIVDLPFAVSPVIAGFMLILLFGRGGWLAPFADALGVKVVFAVPGMLLAVTFVSLPFAVREVTPVLAHAGVDQELAALTLGARPWQAFWHVTLPTIRWAVFYGVSLTFARALGEFGAVLVVGGGVSGSTETATLYIFRSLDDRNQTGAFAMAFTLAATSLAVLAIMEVAKRRLERDGEGR